MDPSALYRLLSWLSPSYPTGAFSYSHGLEYAVETGLVHDRLSLAGWVGEIVRHGAGRLDAALFCAAYRAAAAGDDAALAEVAELGAAWRGTAETAEESAAQGAAFLAVTRAAWPDPALDRLARAWDGPVVAPVAVAVACAGSAAGPPIPLPAALAAMLQAFAANLVSAGIRLIPLGQTDGQIALAALADPIAATVERALVTPLDEAGSASPVIDWTSMRHETQYTRLFRS